MRHIALRLASALSLLAMLLGAMLVAALVAPLGHAQARGARGAVSVGLSGRGAAARPLRRRLFNGAGYLAAPFFYPDYGSEPVYYDEQPAPLVVEPPQPPPHVAVSPLLLENRGGQWVRVPTGDQVATAPTDSVPVSQAAQEPPPKLPPAVLVFRDGHQEEIEKYTIQGNTLSTPANYWATGAWQRKISLSDLDIPATLKINQERGGKFALPSGPNEVMVRF